jgi:hypothetical protein
MDTWWRNLKDSCLLALAVTSLALQCDGPLSLVQVGVKGVANGSIGISNRVGIVRQANIFDFSRRALAVGGELDLLGSPLINPWRQPRSKGWHACGTDEALAEKGTTLLKAPIDSKFDRNAAGALPLLSKACHTHQKDCQVTVLKM